MGWILASNNKGKIAEIIELLPDIAITTMSEAGYTDDIPEPFASFRENAWQKAKTIYDWSGMPVIADDSGLCVDVLNGAPGVYSARYAGQGASDDANNEKLLVELTGVENRSAYYIAVLCVIVAGDAQFFEGRCSGKIAGAPRGKAGFGYDPLFIPEGYNHTFGELDALVKKQISHRAKALRALSGSGLLVAY